MQACDSYDLFPNVSIIGLDMFYTWFLLNYFFYGPDNITASDSYN